MKQSPQLSLVRIPHLLILSLLLAMSLTFTACGGGDVDLESDRLEEGVGGDEGLGDEGDLDGEGGLDEEGDD